MQSWFGLNPLDVILGTVAFCTAVFAVIYVCMGVKNHRAQKQAERERNRASTSLDQRDSIASPQTKGR